MTYAINELGARRRIVAVLTKLQSEGGGCDPLPDPTTPEMSRQQQLCLAIIRATYLAGLLECNDNPECCAAWNAWYNGATAECLAQADAAKKGASHEGI
jgi:hypothetical protein